MPPPSLNIPPSQSTVAVSAINTTTNIISPSKYFVEPIIKGHEHLQLPTFAFLIQNKTLNKSILFDAGSRKDWWNFSPANVKAIDNAVPALEIEKGVDEILTEGGVALNSIEGIVWSHYHWDHLGDASKFPKTTNLIVGPGFKKNFMPGYPTNPDAYLLESDYEGREVIEISFKNGLKIGQFEAHDFFNDGSFYILNTPGHAPGHISALARVTPTTFIFLGGDICHFGGMFRPNEFENLPSTIPDSKNAALSRFNLPCPCSIFTDIHPLKDTKAAQENPFYKVTTMEGSWYTDPPTAQASVDALKEFDASDDVFVAIAHDSGLLDVIDFFPKGEMNEWRAKGWKEKSHWGFLGGFPVKGGPENIARGVVREGKVIKPFTGE